MDHPINRLDETFATCGQLQLDDLPGIAQQGYRSIICNRPDHEGGPEQPLSEQLRRQAEALGLSFVYLPVIPSTLHEGQAQQLQALLSTLPHPILAFCRTGNRSTQLYRMACENEAASSQYDVVIMGGGSAGIGVAASLLRRAPELKLAVVEPSDHHYYQPAWTLVGGGAYDAADTVRPMASVMPHGVTWIQASVSAFAPERQSVLLSNGKQLGYQQLIICPGLQLAWERITGLEDTLGQQGVTSNYRYDLAPYTWELVRNLRHGKALFTQPGMPIKCAGAPQKAMYLSCDHWLRQGVLKNIQVEFNLAGAALFGVPAFVPPLMAYVEKYQASLAFQSNLVAVDGPGKTAWFEVTAADGSVSRQAKAFDLLHVVPPQQAPDVVRRSTLADAAGWLEVDPATLQHPRHPDIFALGDVCGTSNAKTAAAARKQIVVVAENLLALRKGHPLPSRYDGYGSCPLTVEKGKVILAEFGYGGKLLPTFPFDPKVPRKSAWLLKASVLPRFYWNGMLKGREWLTRCAQN